MAVITVTFFICSLFSLYLASKSYIMKIVDTRGLRCPAPLIKTRQALNEASAGESLQIITDNTSSLNNIRRYLTDNHLAFTEKENGGLWSLTVDRGEQVPVADNAEDYCTTELKPTKKKTVVSVSSDIMGTGDDVLGGKLITSFFKVLPMINPQPEKVVFYNTGVRLAVKDSPVEEYLKELQESGTEIVLCATCVDYFCLKDKLTVGRVGDMYQIINILNEADNIIRP